MFSYKHKNYILLKKAVIKYKLYRLRMIISIESPKHDTHNSNTNPLGVMNITRLLSSPRMNRCCDRKVNEYRG